MKHPKHAGFHRRNLKYSKHKPQFKNIMTCFSTFLCETINTWSCCDKAEIPLALEASLMLPFEVHKALPDTSIYPAVQLFNIPAHSLFFGLAKFCFCQNHVEHHRKHLKHIYDSTCRYADKIHWHHMITHCLTLVKSKVSAEQPRILSYPLSIHKQLVNDAPSRSSSCTNHWHFRLLQETVYKSDGTNDWKGKRNVYV